MGAQHTALDVADALVRLSIRDEIPITHLQVQKLTYFCHAWMLANGHGPLFQDAVESWQYGPVVRALYHRLKRYGENFIREALLPEAQEFIEKEEWIINTVWRLYGRVDGGTLSRITHAEGGPWHQTFTRDRRSQIIHNHVIRDYYAGLLDARRAQQNTG